MGEKLRILILEDVPSDAELARRELRKSGISFVSKRVETRDAFLARLENFAPDVILADYQLPQFDGMSALKLARDRLSHVPVIMFTGSINEETAVECIKAGAADYVLKTHLARLGPAVEGAVERFRERANRQRAEEELRDSEQRLKILFEFAPDAYYLTDLNGRVVDGNKATEGLFGLSRRELIGRSFLALELLSPEDVLKAGSLLAKNALGEGTGPDEFVLTRRDGGSVTAEIRTFPVKIKDRHLVLGIARDVTERKQAETELKKSEKRFRDVLESAADGIVIVDDQQQIVLVNKQAEQLFGYTRQELIGQPVHMLVPLRFGDHRKHVEGFLAKPRSRAMGQRQELFARRKDGTEVSIEVSLSPLETDEGLLVTAVVYDVTERRQADEALRRSEQQYRDLVERATYGIYRSTSEGRFESVNPALVEMLGYDSEAELLALEMATDVYVDPADRSRLVEYYRQGERAAGLDEVEWKRKDGSRITVRLGGRPVRNEAGEVKAFEMFVEDVTERQALEAQLRQAQKMEAVGRLAGGVAHDFNNLLTVIVGESEMALADLPEEAPAREGLTEIRKAADRAAALTRQLLTFSRRQIVEPTVFNLNGLVREMDKMLRRLIGEDVDLAIRTAPDLGNVEADRGQMEQVVMNLAVNARDAMPEGGRLVIETANVTLDETYTLTHAGVSAGDYVKLSVSDSGTGMTEETMAHLFEPFFTTKEKGQGTGLGLATSYGIVEQGGGHIAAYSEVGIGTTMKVYLPRVATRTGHTGEFEVAAPTRGTETVLLVEDEERVLAVGKRILEGQGYTVLAAPDGEEALRLVENHTGSLHLLLTDVVLPKMDGRRLAERVKKLRPDIKVLFTSGYTEDVVLKHRLVAGEATLLQKPFTMQSLMRSVREVLERS